jgi:hypothetical protein
MVCTGSNAAHRENQPVPVLCREIGWETGQNPTYLRHVSRCDAAHRPIRPQRHTGILYLSGSYFDTSAADIRCLGGAPLILPRLICWAVVCAIVWHCLALVNLAALAAN